MLNQDTPTMLEVRQRIVSGLANLIEITEDPLFEEWLETIYCGQLFGLDFLDVFDLTKYRHAKLIKLVSSDLKSLKGRIRAVIPRDCKGVIAAVKLPKGQSIETVIDIAESIIDAVNTDVDVLWQAKNYSKQEIALILLIVSLP